MTQTRPQRSVANLLVLASTLLLALACTATNETDCRGADACGALQADVTAPDAELGADLTLGSDLRADSDREDAAPGPDSNAPATNDADAPTTHDTDDASSSQVDSDLDLADTSDAPGEPGSLCPLHTVQLGTTCMDRWEAPNIPGKRPLVMYNFYEAEKWCNARGKRLCYDDEWQKACEGPKKWKYPYGNTREPGRCNDAKVWRTYSASKLSLWPAKVATEDIESWDELYDKVSATGANGVTVATHLEWLYQADTNGENPKCVGPAGVEDLVGSVEEWTRRRDGGSSKDFSGNLKGRYWAESRTCQSSVLVHANAFRFYEIGFRCCLDLPK